MAELFLALAEEKQLFLTMSRADLLVVLGRILNELTLCGRDAYGAPDEAMALGRVSEAVHRVVGHLRGLLHTDAPMTECRADGICEQLNLLGLNAHLRIFAPV